MQLNCSSFIIRLLKSLRIVQSWFDGNLLRLVGGNLILTALVQKTQDLDRLVA
ncbi:uncharacterized protein G2W53_022529 [Senna tora]|uniref:Uncharacterized protein n=1 Tax=Senna tora TaxID=362788 RepID=A0A834TM54_9FABA|nr:uncharacterized protein G2W53_022529 [Senna tora]